MSPDKQSPDEQPLEEPRPFELEPESEDPAKKQVPLPKKRAGETEEAPAAPVDVRLRYREREIDPSEADERTVAEREGVDVPRGTEDVPLPEDWPVEAFSFPLRKPGPAFIAAGTGTLLVLDLMSAVTAVAFVAWAAKLVLLVFVLRGQIRVIGSSAAGHDAPVGWHKALLFERDDLGPYLKTLGMFVLLLAPGVLVLIFGNWVLGLVLVCAGSMYAAVVALGAALGDPSLKYPWNAFGWMGRRPVCCLAGSAGWWMLFLAEWSLGALSDPGLGLLAFLSLVLRAACFYALLVSARAIGVMGRAWAPA